MKTAAAAPDPAGKGPPLTAFPDSPKTWRAEGSLVRASDADYPASHYATVGPFPDPAAARIAAEAVVSALTAPPPAWALTMRELLRKVLRHVVAGDPAGSPGSLVTLDWTVADVRAAKRAVASPRG